MGRLPDSDCECQVLSWHVTDAVCAGLLPAGTDIRRSLNAEYGHMVCTQCPVLWMSRSMHPGARALLGGRMEKSVQLATQVMED